MPKLTKVSQQIMEFDLNAIFQLSYSFDVLKKVIDRIVVEVDQTNDKYASVLDKLIKKVNSHEQKISQNSRAIEGAQRNVDFKFNNLGKLSDVSDNVIQDHSNKIEMILMKL